MEKFPIFAEVPYVANPEMFTLKSYLHLNAGAIYKWFVKSDDFGLK